MSHEQQFHIAPELKDAGPARIYKFLERTGFLEHLRNNREFREWFTGMDFDTFSDHIARLNGIVRGIGAAHRGPVKGRSKLGQW